MAVKRSKEKDGIFIRRRRSVSANDENFPKVMKAWITQTMKQNTPEYILNTLERKARAILKQTGSTVKTRSPQRKKELSAAFERRKKDAELILSRIDMIRALRRDKNHDQAFVDAFHLGQLVIKTDVRLIEPDTLLGIGILQDAARGAENKERWAATIHEIWIEHALEIKAKKPSYNPHQIAGKLYDKYQENSELWELRREADTIYKILRVIPELKTTQKTIYKKPKKLK